MNSVKAFTDQQIKAVEAVFGKYGVEATAVWDKPREWDITTNYHNGIIRLIHLDPYMIIPFDSPTQPSDYAEREHTPLPPPWGKAE